MENVHSTDHGRLVHEWEIVNSPGNASNLGSDLDEDLVDDGSEVLSLGNGVAKHDLGRYWEFRQQESLDVIVERSLSFLTG